MNILIIGYGPIGKLQHESFADADIHDEAEGFKAATLIDVSTLTSPNEWVVDAPTHWDVALICVEGPKNDAGEIDDETIEAMINRWKSAVDCFGICSPVRDGIQRRLIAKRLPVMSTRDQGSFMLLHTDRPTGSDDVTIIERTIDRLTEEREKLLESVENARDGLLKAHTVIEGLQREVSALRDDIRKRDSELASMRAIHNKTVEKNRRQENGK
jgi:hypothetical protein